MKSQYFNIIILIYCLCFVSKGIAIGGSCVVCPVYISEFAETSIRGTLGTCFQLFLTIGILFVYACGTLKLSWQLLSWMCLVFPILNLIGLCFLPESPIWLLKNVSNFNLKTDIFIEIFQFTKSLNLKKKIETWNWSSNSD